MARTSPIHSGALRPLPSARQGDNQSPMSIFDKRAGFDSGPRDKGRLTIAQATTELSLGDRMPSQRSADHDGNLRTPPAGLLAERIDRLQIDAAPAEQLSSGSHPQAAFSRPLLTTYRATDPNL